jgi:hypothetical protein
MECDDAGAHGALAGFLGDALDDRLVAAVDTIEDTNR